MHPRGWAGRGTGERGEPRARRGACPLRGGVRGASRCPAGGVPGWLSAYPAFALLFAPYPPTPFPTGRGRPKLFHARGFAPCIPGAGRGAALGKGANHAPGGGRAPYRAGLGGHPGARRGACPVGCPLSLPLACFSAPYPPTPFPGGEGGDFYFISPGATAPGTPCG